MITPKSQQKSLQNYHLVIKIEFGAMVEMWLYIKSGLATRIIGESRIISVRTIIPQEL